MFNTKKIKALEAQIASLTKSLEETCKVTKRHEDLLGTGTSHDVESLIERTTEDAVDGFVTTYDVESMIEDAVGNTDYEERLDSLENETSDTKYLIQAFVKSMKTFIADNDL